MSDDRGGLPVSGFDDLEARMKSLANEKARLSTIYYMYEKFAQVHGLDDLIDTTLSLIMDFYGGLNIVIYYRLHGDWYAVDVDRTPRQVEISTDPEVKAVIRGKEYCDIPCEEVEESRLRDYKVPKGARQRTLVFPLRADDETIGAIKIEGIWLHDLRFVKDLPVFLRYVALSLSHELHNYNALEEAYNKLKKINRQLAASQEEITHSLEEKTVLLQEVHHRVKNNLQMIASMFNLQEEYTADKQALALLRETGSRIRSMGIIHEKLYRSGDFAQVNFKDYVSTLMAKLVQLYRPTGLDLDAVIKTNGLQFDLDTAIPLGLMINELVTNALKYAFRDRKKGRVTVRLTRLKSKKTKLTVADDGVGLPDHIGPEKEHKLGIRLVRLLTIQLEGTLKVSRTGGTSFSVTF